MAIGAITLGLTLTSIGLSAYASKQQVSSLERQARLQGQLDELNTLKYEADLKTQQTGVLKEAKMAMDNIVRNDANRNAGVNTASQSLVQNIMGEIEASERNITKNVRDMEFNDKMAGLNAKMGIENARREAGLNFLGQALGAGANLYGEHRADVRHQDLSGTLEGAIQKNRSSIQEIMDNMKF